MKITKCVCLTHNDGDALGCMVIFEMTFKPERYFVTHYGDLVKQVQDIIAYADNHDIQRLCIADVSFAGRRDLLIKLSERFDIKFIDHHLYPEGFFEGIEGPKFTLFHDTNRAACRILYDMRRKLCPATAISAIDSFDTYDTQQSNFLLGLVFNSYVRMRCHNDASLMLDLAHEVIEANQDLYKVLGFFNDRYVTSFNSFRNDAFAKGVYVKANKGCNISISLVEEYFSMFVYTELSRDADVVLGVTKHNILVRIKQGAFSTKDVLAAKRYLVPENPTIGHLLAWPVHLDSEAPDVIVNTLANIAKVFNETPKVQPV